MLSSRHNVYQKKRFLRVFLAATGALGDFIGDFGANFNRDFKGEYERDVRGIHGERGILRSI